MATSSSSRLLALRKTAGAEAVFIVFTHKHPDLAGKEPPYRQAPLANFLWFLLSTITSSRYPELEEGRGRGGKERGGEGRGREGREGGGEGRGREGGRKGSEREGRGREGGRCCQAAGKCASLSPNMSSNTLNFFCQLTV